MKYHTHSALLGSAASAVLALGMASPALAFENITWTWNKVIDEVVTKTIDINAEINPTGMTEVEKLQIQIGDVNATSTVSGIYNEPIRDGGSGTGSVIIDETFTFNAPVDDVPDPSIIGGADGVGDGDSLVTATLLPGGENDEGADTVMFDIQVEGEVPFEFVPAESLDAALDLPAVESTATAVGNNQSITSSVSTQLHDAQFLFNVNEDGGDSFPVPIGVASVDGGDDDGGNTHTDIALAVALGAMFGVIDKAEITASSEVYDILNATVASSATAVGNNMNVEVNAVSPGDALLIADITQVSVADVSAYSNVYGVTIEGYNNLAAVSPIVSSTATAVGNNLNITVSSPDGN
ncbi:MAG: hypothetical protein RQ752_00405 [Thermohalobaculum sp.]|nr:hypothetical protein [Thermohalobaculum sp.]